jgi:hypothetical protein
VKPFAPTALVQAVRELAAPAAVIDTLICALSLPPRPGLAASDEDRDVDVRGSPGLPADDRVRPARHCPVARGQGSP